MYPTWLSAQFGHVSAQMMAIYSHVRRKALIEAAAALEPEANCPGESSASRLTPWDR